MMLLKKILYAITATQIIAVKQEQSINELSSLNEHEKLIVETCTFNLPNYSVIESDVLGEIFFQKAYDSLKIPCRGYHFDIQFDTDQTNNVYAFLTDEYGPFVHHGIELEINNYDGQLHIYIGGVIVPTDDMLIPQSDSYTYNIVSAMDGLSIYLDTVLITSITHDEAMYKNFFNNGTKNIYFGGSKSGQIISNIKIKCLNYDNACSLNRKEGSQRKQASIEPSNIAEKNSKITTQEKYSLEEINTTETDFGPGLYDYNFSDNELFRENKIYKTNKDIINNEFTIYETDSENFSHKEAGLEEYSQFETGVWDDDLDATDAIEDIIDDLDNLNSFIIGIIQDKEVDEEKIYHGTRSFQHTFENSNAFKTITEEFISIKKSYSKFNLLESEKEEIIPLKSSDDKISEIIDIIEGNKSVDISSKISTNNKYSVEDILEDFDFSNSEFQSDSFDAAEYEYNTKHFSVHNISVDIEYGKNKKNKKNKTSFTDKISSIEDKLEGKYLEEIAKNRVTTEDNYTKIALNPFSIINTEPIHESSYKSITLEEINPSEQSYEGSLESRGIKEEIENEEMPYNSTIKQDEFLIASGDDTRTEKKSDKVSLVGIKSFENDFTEDMLSEYLNSKETIIDVTTALKFYSESDMNENDNSVINPHFITQNKIIIKNSAILNPINLDGDIDFTAYFDITSEETITEEPEIEVFSNLKVSTGENKIEEIITTNVYIIEASAQEITSEKNTVEEATAEEINIEEIVTEELGIIEDHNKESNVRVDTNNLIKTGEILSEEIATEDNTTEEIATEEIATKNNTTEEVTAQEVKDNGFKIKETKTEEVKTQKISTEEVTEEKIRAKKVTVGLITAMKIATVEYATEEIATEAVRAEEITADGIKTEKIATEEISTELIKTELISTELISTELISTELISTEEISTEEISAGVISAGLILTEEISTEEIAAEETATEKFATEEVATEGITTGEITIEEIKIEEIATEDTAGKFNESIITYREPIMKLKSDYLFNTDSVEADFIFSEEIASVLEINAESVSKEIPTEEGNTEKNRSSRVLGRENFTYETSFKTVTSEEIYSLEFTYADNILGESRFDRTDSIRKTLFSVNLAEKLGEETSTKHVNNAEIRIEGIANEEYSSIDSVTNAINFDDTAIYVTSIEIDSKLDYGRLDIIDLDSSLKNSNAYKFNFVESTLQNDAPAASSLEIGYQDKDSKISADRICADLNTTFGPLNLNSTIIPKNYRNFIEIPCCGLNFQIEFTTFSQSDLYMAFLDKDGLLSENLFIESQFGVQTNRNAIRKGRSYYIPKRNLTKRHNTYIESIAKYQHIDGTLYIYKDGKFSVSSSVNGISIKKVYFSTLQHLAYIFNGKITCL
ncbi:hypothetical protein AYI70_g8558 [Smittium culicis]|uniref:Uncharacterized protein n=1 Tax=Smittium culicis TaxID=133412 RepID=A0A1R1XFE3_9FUNG|nr:hypothetical protein AYI70_g8558 [Smittium culicis]